MDDDVRVEPGISLWKLFLIFSVLFYAISYGSVVFLAISVYLLFSALVAEGFWPYLSEEDARAIRRRKILGEDDDTSGDSQE